MTASHKFLTSLGFGELLPLTHYIRLCRSILLRGTPLWDLGGGLAVLALMSAVGRAAATPDVPQELV